MKKKHLLFTTLALALGSLTGGSEAMAQAGWESAFSQSQTSSTTWEALSTGSTEGKTLGESGTTKYYYLQESLTFTNTNAGGSGLTIKGTVYLYIPYGLTITCVGADGSGATGGGAGIELAEGNTLYIIGGGTGCSVTATGGNAANGSNGNDGTYADGGSGDWTQTGAGGKGGDGGGGAGAGIGTRGGAGGSGGGGGASKYYNNGAQDDEQHGTDGSSGTAGSSASAMGNLYVDQTLGITVNATGGSAGTIGGNGGGRGRGYAYDGYSYNVTVAGGGGGGAGGFGGAAANIGTGGPGGGGGGGGAGGSQDWRSNSSGGVYNVNAYGGKGGKNANGNNAGSGADADCSTWNTVEAGSFSSSDWHGASGNVNFGSGGSGGAKGANDASNGSTNAGQLKYNITYQPIKTRVNGSNTNSVTVQYAPSSATTVILPRNVEGYQWVLSVYGKDCSSNAQITKSVFTQAKKTSYGGNEEDDAERTITLADVYGNLTFVEVASLCKLNNNNTNDQTIAEFCQDFTDNTLNYPITVRLKDRTLYKDNHWNTICLPFNLTPEQFAQSPLKGAQVKKLDEYSGYYPNGGTIGVTNYTEPTLYFSFTTINTSTETLQAGYPYLVKWASGEDLVDNTTKGKKSAVHQLDFTGVQISSTAPTFWEGNGASEGAIQFVGTYSPTALTANDKTKLVLSNEDKLYYPTKNMSVNSCRGYFILPAKAVNAREMVLSFDDDEMTTTIQTLNVDKGSKDDNAVYNLNGQRLSAPRKGLNIVNGKKVIIK